VTEADWRLFTTLLRFDPVYHLHFKCNRKRIIDYPNLWAYTRELYQWPGVQQTIGMDHIVRHYHYSHDTINPNRILPINPVIDWLEPHGRGSGIPYFWGFRACIAASDCDIRLPYHPGCFIRPGSGTGMSRGLFTSQGLQW
jgi:hypothetical protein